VSVLVGRAPETCPVSGRDLGGCHPTTVACRGNGDHERRGEDGKNPPHGEILDLATIAGKL
jgi:hypothetical protein